MEDFISLGIQIDDDSLNKEVRRIESRIKNLKIEICPSFCDDAFSYKIDDRPLQLFEQSINKLVKNIQAQTIALNLKIKAPTIDNELKSILAGTENRTVTVRYKDITNERTGYQNQTKEVVLGLQRVERAISRQKTGLGVFDGIKLGFGQTIARGIDQQVKRNFGISGTGIGKQVVNQA